MELVPKSLTFNRVYHSLQYKILDQVARFLSNRAPGCHFGLGSSLRLNYSGDYVAGLARAMLEIEVQKSQLLAFVLNLFGVGMT